MSNDTFERFLAQLPDLLQRFPDATSDLADRFLGDVQTDSGRHTVTLAVTGKMKQGKSSLINALIDRDLPTTGVTEATATINRVKHPDEGSIDQFVVRWRDSEREDSSHDLSEFRNFMGESGRAMQDEVEHTTFYADADFLKDLVLVDTPGEQGTLLRAIKIRPDALVRALPFDVEARDQDTMQQYADETRVHGSWAFNTIGVIQQWEQHWPSNSKRPFEDSPLDAAVEIAKHQSFLLKESVSTVVPVSGLLWQFGHKVNDETLTAVLAFARQQDDDTLEALMVDESLFRTLELENSSPADRDQMIDGVVAALGNHGSAPAWTMLRMTVWAARRSDTVAALREELLTLSNMREFRSLLEKRFFRRTRLLALRTTLKKALDIAEEADDRLNALADDMRQQLEDALQAEREVAAQCLTPQLPTTVAYIAASVDSQRRELKRLENTLFELQRGAQQTKQQFALVEHDTAALEALDSSPQLRATLEAVELLEPARALFGTYGDEPRARLALEDSASAAEAETAAFEQKRRWMEQEYNPAIDSLVFKAGSDRLNMLCRALVKPRP